MALTDNLISVWEGENSGNLGLDSHSTGNNLTNTNGVTQTTGKVSNCPSFATASSQSLRIASNTSLQATGSFSIAAWVNFSTVANAGLVTKSDVAGGSYEYNLQYSNGYGFAFQVRETGLGSFATIVHASGTKSSGVWYFVTGVYDSSGPTIHVNVDAGTRSSISAPASLENLATDFCLGSFADQRFLNGLLDQVCFWKRAITTAEETELYNGGAGLSYAAMGGGAAASHLLAMMAQNEG